MLGLDWAPGGRLGCPGCGGDADWDIPDCQDGHGTDCPERFCRRCGLAVWAGLIDQDRRDDQVGRAG